MKLPPDWSELIGLLCAERVRFVIVGAHALAVHGRPRATGDVDILVEPTVQNARRLGRALHAFGFPALAAAAARFAENGLEEFLANKRAPGRTKDLLDLALLREGGVVPKPRAKRRPPR